jgi:hypothetical protein
VAAELVFDNPSGHRRHEQDANRARPGCASPRRAAAKERMPRDGVACRARSQWEQHDDDPGAWAGGGRGGDWVATAGAEQSWHLSSAAQAIARRDGCGKGQRRRLSATARGQAGRRGAVGRRDGARRRGREGAGQ